MDSNLALSIVVPIVATIVIGLIAAIYYTLKGSAEKNANEIKENREEIKEIRRDYATKEEVKEVKFDLNEYLKRIEDKQDKILDLLIGGAHEK